MMNKIYSRFTPKFQERIQGVNADRNALNRIIRPSRTVQPGNAPWRTVRESAPLFLNSYPLSELNVSIDTGSDNWTTREWYRHDDESVPTYNSTSTRPAIPIASNPSGFEWNRSLVFDTGYGPVKADFPGAGVAHYTQQTETLIELLAEDGSTLKTATVTTEWQFDFDPSGPSTTSENYTHSNWSFDSNGSILEFWGIRVTLSLSDSPTWIDALNNTYFFSLKWIEGIESNPDTIDDSYPWRERLRRLTVHLFGTHELSGVMDSDVVYFNPSDTSQPFPWPMNNAYYTPVNKWQESKNYTHLSTDPPIVQPDLTLWCTDAAGNELFQLYQWPATYSSGEGPIAYGLKWKLNSPDVTCLFNVGNPCILLWDFQDDNGNHIGVPVSS